MPLDRYTQSDFVYKLTHGDNRDRFLLWVGAGASVQAGIPAAASLVTNELKDFYRRKTRSPLDLDARQLRDWAEQNLTWYQDGLAAGKSEYDVVLSFFYHDRVSQARLFERLDLAANRSAGYDNLARLMAGGFFRTLITTNFDQLIRRSYDRISSTPLIEINSPALFRTVERFESPHLLRLHGDLWNANLVNDTNAEDAYSPDRLKAVARLMRGRGLIVAGYGGSDRRINRELFDRLGTAQRVSGIYWCLRGGDPNPSVRAFLEGCGGDAALVDIEGFDSFMGDLNSAAPSGDPVARMSLLNEYLNLLTIMAEKLDSTAPLAESLSTALSHLLRITGSANGCIGVADPTGHLGAVEFATTGASAERRNLLTHAHISDSFRRVIEGNGGIDTISVTTNRGSRAFVVLKWLAPAGFNPDECGILIAVLRILDVIAARSHPPTGRRRSSRK